MISVALIRPVSPGNMGAIARSMKNFGFKELILVNPIGDHLHEDAIQRATHAANILQTAKVVDNLDYLKEYDYIVGTTSQPGTSDSNIPRTPILAEDFDYPKKSTVIIFGKEDSGMSNEEINFCDSVITIPSSKEYPVMNIAHAATVIFYELFKKSKKESVTSHITLADRTDMGALLNMVDDSLDTFEFATDEKKETQRKVWKRILNKAMLSKKEFLSLCGFFKKIK